MTATGRLPSENAGSTLPTDARAWQNQADDETVNLHRRATRQLASVAGTNAITATTLTGTPAVAAYEAGQSFWLTPVNDSTAAVTVNIDSVGAADLLDRNGDALSSGALRSGTLYQITYDGSDFRIDTTNYTPELSPLPKNYITGFKLSNNSGDANNDIDIGAGVARSSADDVNIEHAASITKRLDAVFAGGTNQGGMLQSANLTGTITITTNTSVTGTGTTFTADFQVGDVIQSAGAQARRITVVTGDLAMTVESAWGSGEAGVTYKRGGKAKNTKLRAYALYKDSDATVDVAFSPRLTPADMPAGYSYYRYIGQILTDASANNRAFTHHVNVNYFELVVPFTESGTGIGFNDGSTTLTSWAPPSVTARQYVLMAPASNVMTDVDRAMVRSTAQTTPPGHQLKTVYADTNFDGVPDAYVGVDRITIDTPLDAAAQFVLTVDRGSVNMTVTISLLGWTDARLP